MNSVPVSSQDKGHPCQVLHQLDFYFWSYGSRIFYPLPSPTSLHEHFLHGHVFCLKGRVNYLKKVLNCIYDFSSFVIPLFYSGAKDWKFNVSEADIRVAKKLCTISKNAFGKNNTSLDLIKEIMKLKTLNLPKTAEEGVLL